MFLRIQLRFCVVAFWILALIIPLPAQTVRSKTKTAPPPKASAPADQAEEIIPRLTGPKGWVWVTQTIDLIQQLGGEESIMTLDGEPVPSMLRKRITLGLIIDDDGHIVTRLIDVTPSKPPLNIVVRALGYRPTTAQFLGMDTVTGLCVLKANDDGFPAADFPPETSLLPRLNIRLYGFHPNQMQNLGSGMIAGSPRVNFYSGQIVKATEDFRYNFKNPIYQLVSPQITPAQDCSLILDKDDQVFGMAIYDTGSQGKHLVYPISRIQSIAEEVIKSHQSIAHGWLGATGIDAAPTIPTALSKPTNEDLGVRVTAVAPDSPAELAGVRPKDILLSVNDRKVETYAQLASVIRQLPADSDVTLRVKRGREYKFLKAKLAPAPSIEPEQQLFAFARRLESMEEELKAMAPNNPNRQKLESRVGMMRLFVGAVTTPAPPEIRLRVFYGFEVQPISGQLMNYFAVTNGLLISSVLEGKKAARAGLQAGDVITRVGEAPVNNLTALINALDKSSNETIELTVSRRRDQVKISFQR